MAQLHRDSKTLANTGSSPVDVILEPWGMVLPLEPSTRMEITAVGREPGTLEVVTEGTEWVVFAWPSATIEARVGDVVVYEGAGPVPPIPVGVTVQQFMTTTGLEEIR